MLERSFTFTEIYSKYWNGLKLGDPDETVDARVNVAFNMDIAGQTCFFGTKFNNKSGTLIKVLHLHKLQSFITLQSAEYTQVFL